MPDHRKIPELDDAVSRDVVDGALKVHSTLGPGLLESVYETCLHHELRKRNRQVERQVSLPIRYDSLHLDASLRLDLLVEDRVIIEVKSVERILPIHEAQLLTYLKLANKRVGLLINFNVRLVKDGIRRMVI